MAFHHPALTPPSAKATTPPKRYTYPMTPTEIAAIPDRDLDLTDISELDECFWQNAQLVEPDRTQSVTLRIKKSVVEAYKAQCKGYQTRMNTVLETYATTFAKSRRQ